ncbi:MAG: restriction endonuclease subunit S [Bacteroidia bacterium]|nr:restriction endonuclease subunit S [Bacteroidia bacterium]
MAKGVKPGINRNDVYSISVPIPPLPEQQRIVSILNEIFTDIDQAKTNLQQNLNNAKELFQSELNNIFSNPALSKAEGKGDGWVEKKLVEVCTLKSGTTISEKLEKESGDTAYLKVADMNFEGNEDRVSTSSRFVNKNEINEKNIFPIGTIIFPKRGGAIATNKKRITDIPICADLNIMGAIALPNMYSEFLFFYFKKFNLIDIANGTTIPQINNYSFEPLIISFPKSLEEQKKIVHQLDTLQTETKKLEEKYQQKLTALEELKQSILQKTFNGEL